MYDCRSTNNAKWIFTLSPASVTSTVEVSATEVAVETTNPDSRTSHYLGAGGRLASERPRFCAVGDADARDHARNQHKQLFQRRPKQRSLDPRFLFPICGRVASQQHRLAARWQRQQRIDRWRHFDPAVDRCDSGIQSSDIQLLSRIRYACGSDSAGHNEVGLKQIHGSVFEFFRNTSLDAAASLRPPESSSI